MKKKILSILAVMLCLPALLFCGCKNDNISELPSINMSRYYKSTVQAVIDGGKNSNDTKATIKLADLIGSKPNSNTLEAYSEIKLSGELNWLYKMYIDSVSFYVYTNSAPSTELTITLSMSNLANENDFSKAEIISDTKTSDKVNGNAYLFTFKINKVIASDVDASSDYLKISINECRNGTIVDNENNLTGFKWTIYDLKVYGESRTYSK